MVDIVFIFLKHHINPNHKGQTLTGRGT